ncbi:MAG: hypothetical protein GYB68_06190 [Chloroflexi bacterium]|nr:hypothetical protein [Chloroflexota bacterium]
MDTFTIRQLDDYKAILVILHPGYRLSVDYPEARLKALFAALPEPYHFIVDFTQLSPSMEDLMRTATATARGESPLLQNPNVNRIFILTHSTLVKLAAKGLNSPIFGHVNITVHSALSEVFNDICELWGEWDHSAEPLDQHAAAK